MIFKIHYALWYGSLVGIMPFMFNYATEYCGVSATQYGMLYTVLPFVALLAKPMVCSIADRHSSHKKCLLLFMLATMAGYGSLVIYPFITNLVENKTWIWFLFCLAAFVGNTSMGIVNSLGDSLAINSCQRKNIDYGQYRLWGPVGFGTFGAIWGMVSEVPMLPRYTPGIMTMVILLIVNSLIIYFWSEREEFIIINSSGTSLSSADDTSSTRRSSNQASADDVYKSSSQVDVHRAQEFSKHIDDQSVSTHIGRLELLYRLGRRQTSIFAYMFIFAFCGALTSIHWQFFFGYLGQIAAKDNSSFSLLATLALVVQAFGGEIVFFMLSGVILRKIGSSITLVVCLLSFAARYLLYAFVIPNVSVFWILPVELLQGPAFGLMYSVLTHQANHYSERIDEMVAEECIHEQQDAHLKNSLHATLQGLLGSAFEGLGLGLGAIIGGRSYDVAPVLMWQIAGFSALFVAIICWFVMAIAPAFKVAFVQDRPMHEQSKRGKPQNDVAVDTRSLIIDKPDSVQALDELRHIGRICQQQHPRPSMRDIRLKLEELSR